MQHTALTRSIAGAGAPRVTRGNLTLRLLGCVAAGAVFLTGSALAQTAPSNSDVQSIPSNAGAVQTLASNAAAPAPINERSLLAPGDRVAITIFDQPDMSGTYFVEPGGTIALPLIGAVPVTQMTPQTLQADLIRRFGDGYLQNPMVSVRLTELRPVTVVGQVRAPGRYNFIDGMTVETVAGLAGGLLRLTGDEAVQRADYLQAEERMKSLTLAHLSQLARKARLEAQLGGTELKQPAVAPSEAETMAGLIEGERQIMSTTAAAQERQKALLTEQAKQIQGDITAFTDQVALENEQIALLEGQIKELQSLVNNGLTRKATVFDIERQRSQSRANLSNLMGSLARAKSLLAENELKREDLDNAFRTQVMGELQNVKLQLAETEANLPLAAEARQIRFDRMPVAAQALSGPPSIKILRYRAGRTETIAAELGNEIWPGDIVQIGDGTAAGFAAPTLPATTGATAIPGALPPQTDATGTIPNSTTLPAAGIQQFSQR